MYESLQEIIIQCQKGKSQLLGPLRMGRAWELSAKQLKDTLVLTETHSYFKTTAYVELATLSN